MSYYLPVSHPIKRVSRTGGLTILPGRILPGAGCPHPPTPGGWTVFPSLFPTVFRKCRLAPGGEQPVSSVGSSGEAGKEKINSGCLDFLARPERGDLPGSFPYMARLLWAGSLLQAPPPPAVSAGGGPLLVTWDSGAVEAGQGSRRRAGPRTCPCGPCTNWPAIVALGCLG